MTMRFIRFEHDGEIETLRSEAAARRAVEAGRIGPETPITTADEDGEVFEITAKDHFLLRSLLGLDQPEPEPAPEPPPPPPKKAAIKTPPALQTNPAKPVLTDTSAPEQDEWAAVDVAPPAEPELADLDPPAPSGGGDSRLKILGWIVGIGLLLLVLISSCDTKTPEVAATAAATEAATEAVDPDAGLTVLDLYLVRETVVRDAPTRDSRELARLDRGMMVSGVEVTGAGDPQYTWLKLKQGVHAGSFVSMRNLSVNARPTLDTSRTGVWYLTEDLTPIEEPQDAAAGKAGTDWRLTTGGKVTVVGVTGARLFNAGWAEITLDQSTGVGYVPFDKLTSEPPFTEEAYDAASDAAAYATDASASGPRPFYINNACAEDLWLLFRYETASGAVLIDATIPARSQRILTDGGRRVLLTSPIIHYAYLSIGSRNARAAQRDLTETFRGRRYAMRRWTLPTDGDGDYAETFRCDE